MKSWESDRQEPYVKPLNSESYEELVFALRNEIVMGKVLFTRDTRL